MLTKILKPLVGIFPHHVHSTQDFIEQANKVTLIPMECLSSYDDVVEDVAMGSPVSSIVGNLHIESFKKKALSNATPQIWLRYVDETWVV